MRDYERLRTEHSALQRDFSILSRQYTRLRNRAGRRVAEIIEQNPDLYERVRNSLDWVQVHLEKAGPQEHTLVSDWLERAVKASALAPALIRRAVDSVGSMKKGRPQ